MKIKPPSRKRRDQTRLKEFRRRKKEVRGMGNKSENVTNEVATQTAEKKIIRKDWWRRIGKSRNERIEMKK